MHNMSSLEADGLQEQKTTPGIDSVSKGEEFTQAHQSWTIEDWKSVAGSNKSRFLL